MGTIVRSLGHCPSESQLQEAKVLLTIFFLTILLFRWSVRWRTLSRWATSTSIGSSQLCPGEKFLVSFSCFFAFSLTSQPPTFELDVVPMKSSGYLNSLNHHQDHPSREVLACRSRRSLGGIPGEGACVHMLVRVCVCARSSNPLLFNCSCLWWQPQALDVDNTGHIDKEIPTQIFTEEGEAFSEVVQVLFFILKTSQELRMLSRSLSDYQPTI